MGLFLTAKKNANTTVADRFKSLTFACSWNSSWIFEDNGDVGFGVYFDSVYSVVFTLETVGELPKVCFSLFLCLL